MSREENVAAAKEAEKNANYDDMLAAIRKVAESGEELTEEERDLIAVASKQVMAEKREEWRDLIDKQAETAKTDEEKKAAASDPKRLELETKLAEIIEDILGLIKNHLQKSAKSDENVIYYQKMEGDFNRYYAEFAAADKREGILESALAAYKAAHATAESKLKEADPIRLGLSLNFAVFYHDVLNSADRACELAKAAHDKADAVLKALSDEEKESHKEAQVIVEILAENLKMWTAKMGGDVTQYLPGN